MECVRDECDNYDPYKNYDPDYGFKCGECHPVNIARDWIINGFGVAKVGILQSYSQDAQHTLIFSALNPM